MASLLTNGIFPFSSQHVSEFPKGPLLHSIPKSPILRNPNSRTSLKIRADVGYEPKTAVDSPGKNSSSNDDDPLQKFLKRDYKWGFTQEIDSFTIPKGLSEETVRLISSRKNEPDWMLEFRLKSYEKFAKMKEPSWSDNQYPKINFQDICYYSEPKKKPTLNSLDEADPELVMYFEKLGIPLNERNRLANVAVDAVLDSVSIATTHRKTLEKSGVIFCSISEAIKEYPDLIRQYLGRVVPADDNFYAALNAAVFSDGSFVYVPKNTKCPMQISTYFRINAMETGQFERTLIVAEEGSFVEYLEGCTAPSYDTNQLHAAVVELYCHAGAEIKYSTVQNWYAGDEDGRGGIFNFVTKRGLCAGPRSKISWTQADTGTKMIHKGKNTRSRIISKGISAGRSRNCYRGLVQVMSGADNAKNSSQCDSMLIGDKAAANTYPYIQAKNPSARIEHEATTSKIGEDQLFYFQQRGIDYEKAMAAMISGFCRDVFNELPDEFGAEVNQLMSLKLEGSVG
ncbi:Iron-sulfur cluster assembly SufBD protein abci8, chloroplastic [Salvia divinorum]|uniref:Iron-sulfur cluster assembly SufBD protein abci8, chloroplastic n=1 Tax=Salvia divinorum TaxID=28513 RepID=A0ABD1FZR5_SALDI